MKADYEALGLMSGTSLDGLDVALCRFEVENGQWAYSIAAAETISYSESWTQLLSSLPQAGALEISLAHHDYGKWMGQVCRDFIARHKARPSLIASHGHTIFHRPEKGTTLQIGSGAAIAAETGLTTVCDFRSLDVALHGQGAPLVPVGDRLLFGSYNACVNIGGFANISFESDNRRHAFDIGPANILLNRLAALLGKPYDESGSFAGSGKVIPSLLARLNHLDYYSQPAPKSLGREWVEKQVLPLIQTELYEITDLLATITEHVAVQISHVLPAGKQATALLTGGGAHNLYLTDRIKALSSCQIVIPDKLTIDFKEALIFALLGVLRIRGEVNCLAEVTGAVRDNCGGAVYQGAKL
ncbi:MAG: anhydro-N-acetylmuramic acid kinase [Lentimicrobiaceae bacterium]|nr:anhydro-N-acetylmuramic acid kinase [Lentimicrobiaceae bacterium]